jgi:hypothetical protein
MLARKNLKKHLLSGKPYRMLPIGGMKMDDVDFIMAYEGGELNDDEIIAGFQKLIDSGMVWSLQGSYGRMAARLIDAGLCHKKSGGSHANSQR